MNKVTKYLNQRMVGNVFEQPEVMRRYSTDRSILQIVPKMVAVPENTDDIRKVVKFAGQLAKKNLHLGVTPRGSGLDKTGADLGNGIVVDMRKMNKIQEVDQRSRLVRVQAGITIRELNAALSLMGLFVPIKADPDETIGSLIANFSSDDYGGKYNGIYYATDCIEVVTATGDVIQTGRVANGGLERKKELTSFEGAIYRELSKVIDEQFDVISDLRNRSIVDSRGYQMVTQVQPEKGKGFDLMPMFFASQGTLGIITEVILRCELLATDVSRFAVAFPKTDGLMEFVKAAKELEPLEINFYDARIFARTEETGKNPALFSEKFNDGYVLVISFNDTQRKAEKKIARLLKQLPETSAAVSETNENSADFMRIEASLTSYLNDDVNGERCVICDDFYIGDDKMRDFLVSLKEMEETYGKELAIFGSMATRNYAVRPEADLSSVTGRQFVLRFLKEFTGLLAVYDGSITGGSPEGRVKAVVTNGELSDGEFELYTSIKGLFDPENILNPGIKLGMEPKRMVREIRNQSL